MFLTKLVLTALGGIGRAILFGLFTEKLTVRVIFWAVKQVTDRTDNRWDDEVLVFLKEAYAEGTGKAVETLGDKVVPSTPELAEKPAESDAGAAEYLMRQNTDA